MKRTPKNPPRVPPHPPGEVHERRPAGNIEYAMKHPIEWFKSRARKKPEAKP